MSDAAQAVARAYDVSRESLQRLEAYVALLLSWNARINLIGPSTEADLWQRHIADSLQLVPLIPSGARTLVDLGSGAGLPGLVLALAAPIEVHLVESNGKKVAFLREAIRITAAAAQVHQLRIEDFRPQFVPDAVTARALAPLPELLDLAQPFLARGAVGIFPKGQAVERELTDSTRYWRIGVDKHPSRTDPKGSILVVKEIERVAS